MIALAPAQRWIRCTASALAALLLVLPAHAATAAGVAPAMLSVLTYNVAGLPLGFSSSNPEVNTVQISPRLNAFDLVAVQEDFAFHDELIAAIDHPFQSVKDTRNTQVFLDFVAILLDPPLVELGDGLNTFSFRSFTDFARVTWNECFGDFDSGSDCLAPKGFSFARHEVASGVFVDVYNLHADAGGDDDSLAARRANLRQLADFIVANSAGNALIVLGDTNSRYTRAGDILPEFVATTGVSDVWIELVRGGDVPEIGPSLEAGCAISFADADCERVDKIFYRSGTDVAIEALGHAVPEDWVDAMGEQLSDHEPVSAVFGVTFIPEPAGGGFAALATLLALVARRRRPAFSA